MTRECLWSCEYRCWDHSDTIACGDLGIICCIEHMDSERVIYGFDRFPGGTVNRIFDDDSLSGFDAIPLIAE